MKYRRIIIKLILISILSQMRCEALLELIDFKILSSNAGFTGYYIVDGGSINFLEDSYSVSGTFTYEKNAGELKYLEVNATGKNNCTSITIMVYRNKVKVKEAVINAATGTPTLALTYRFGEEEKTATTTTGP